MDCDEITTRFASNKGMAFRKKALNCAPVLHAGGLEILLDVMLWAVKKHEICAPAMGKGGREPDVKSPPKGTQT